MSDIIKVLLVDDESGFTEALERRLSRRGFTVATAPGADEALAILERDGCDVMVSDVKMPGIDGLTLLSIVKKQFPDTEVLLLTGHADIKGAISAMSSGAFDFLLKPVDINLLECRIIAAARSVALKAGEPNPHTAECSLPPDNHTGKSH